MSDEHFMEDESEWPYLVWEKKDQYRQTKSPEPHNLSLNFEDIPFSEFPTYVNRLVLPPTHKNNIINSIKVRPKNCIFSLRQNENGINITLTVKNQHFSSRFNGTYDSNTSNLTFYLPSHDYRSLESMNWFESEVKRVKSETGLGFYGEGGGYEFEWDDGRLTINDEFEVLAYFSDDDIQSDSHSYKVDFENRKLEKYHVHDWLEMFDPVSDF